VIPHNNKKRCDDVMMMYTVICKRVMLRHQPNETFIPNFDWSIDVVVVADYVEVEVVEHVTAA